MKCLLCESSNVKLDLNVSDFEEYKKYKIIRCLSCHAASTLPRLSRRELRKKYSSYREEAKGTRFNFILDYVIAFLHSRRVKTIETLVPKKGKILDVGCGRGIELRSFKKIGWDVKGTELPRNSYYDFPVISKEIWQMKEPKSQYDVIMFLHSLEHLTQPYRALEAADRLLKSGGIITVAVPNYKSFEKEFFGANWFHLDISRHLTHFSLNFFKKWASQRKYKIVKKNHLAPEYDFYSFLQSSLNLLPYFPKNLLYKFLLKKKQNSFSDIVLFTFQVPFIILLSMFWVIVPLLWITSQSGTIELYLKKSK